MKLAYNNWHKEIVHDDAIQSELTGITDGQLDIYQYALCKSIPPQQDNRDRDRGGYGKQRGKFQQRGGGGGGGGRNDRNDRGGGGGKFKKKRY